MLLFFAPRPIPAMQLLVPRVLVGLLRHSRCKQTQRLPSTLPALSRPVEPVDATGDHAQIPTPVFLPYQLP